MMTLGERIRKLRGKQSTNQFASALSISTGLLSAYENDKSKPGFRFLEKLANVYGININWLITEKGPRELARLPVAGVAPNEIAIMSYVAAGANYLEEIPVEDRDMIRLPGNASRYRGAYGLRVIGDSMVDHLYEGDFLVIRELEPKAVRDGGVYVFITGDGPTVKQGYREGKRVRLHSFNPAHADFYPDEVHRVFGILDHIYPFNEGSFLRSGETYGKLETRLLALEAENLALNNKIQVMRDVLHGGPDAV